MDQELCLILGQVSLSSLFWDEKPSDRKMRSGRIDKTASDIQARSFMARTLERKGKECKAEGEADMERPVARPMRSNQNLRVLRKPVNPQDCVLENLYQIIMRTILQ